MASGQAAHPDLLPEPRAPYPCVGGCLCYSLYIRICCFVIIKSKKDRKEGRREGRGEGGKEAVWIIQSHFLIKQVLYACIYT